MNAKFAVRRALELGLVIPAFNIPYLPMVESVTRAIKDTNSVAMVQVARLEWEKFQSGSVEQVAAEYYRHNVPGHTLLHLDHVPAIDEDGLTVDFMADIRRAIDAGYESVMVDGSRLSLTGNIDATREAARAAHAAGIPCEAELGAVMGHETKHAAIPYEEIFRRKMGFTKLDEAVKFVSESECDWLSVAAGSVHGAIAANLRDQKKPAAKLDVEHIRALRDELNVPLVLHGGSGIVKEYIGAAISAGIAKINVATEIRQPYEAAMRETNDVSVAQERVYERTCEVIRDFLGMENDADRIGDE